MRSMLLAALLVGCSVEPLPSVGHLVLVLDTDAPVPGGAANDPPPLFDRVRVEVFPPDADRPCDGCTRVFDLETSALRAGASFTVTIPNSVVHVQMYVSRFAANQQPTRGSTVERWVRAPALPSEGEQAALIFLPTDDVGLIRGSRSEPLETEPVSRSRVGTWPHATRTPCAGAPREGEVCVPGGAFWMGNPLYRQRPIDASDRQRLVVLRPFYIDDREVTVRSARPIAAVRSNIFPWSGTLVGDAPQNWCRFTAAPGPFEDVPVNCIGRDLALEICASRGGELPSEAQFEYVAGALSSRAFVWGEDEGTCDDAVFGRGPAGIVSNNVGLICRNRRGQGGTAANGGPLPLPADPTSLDSLVALSRKRSAVALPGGTVWDLAGNVAEVARDLYTQQDEPCWSQPESNVFFDPVCTLASTADAVRALGAQQYAVRGGSWSDPIGTIRAAARGFHNGDPSPQVGFRCVRAASD